jgi:hypothetical protein
VESSGRELPCQRLESGPAGGYFCLFFIILKNACYNKNHNFIFREMEKSRMS